MFKLTCFRTVFELFSFRVCSCLMLGEFCVVFSCLFVLLFVALLQMEQQTQQLSRNAGKMN
jgi:hypothetical protein